MLKQYVYKQINEKAMKSSILHKFAIKVSCYGVCFKNYNKQEFTHQDSETITWRYWLNDSSSLYKNKTSNGHFWWPNLAETVKRHIYRPRPFIWAYCHWGYSQVSTTIRYKNTAWKRIDDGQTDGHPESIGPQPLGLGNNNDILLLLVYSARDL